MKLILIRHGMTKGNEEKRYIGSQTDEPLSQKGMRQIQEKTYPKVNKVIVSPMKRCKETAKLIYPHCIPIEKDTLRECDFGDFENKNYQELQHYKSYQQWLCSMGNLPFPNGESREAFIKRCNQGFYESLTALQNCDTAAFVVHGGTIMAICSQWYGGEYYQYQIPNGDYLVLDTEKKEE